jgi:hypothetical protein
LLDKAHANDGGASTINKLADEGGFVHG